MTRIVGLDLSLSSTGYAVVHDEAGPVSVTTGTVASKPPRRRKGDPPPTLTQRSTRLRRLAGTITSVCAGADLVLVEGPSYGSDGAGTWDRAGLWWLVVARLTGAGLRVVEVPPALLKTYAVGKGAGAGTDKDHVLAAVVRRYPAVAVEGNDQSDALVLAAIGARFCGMPIEPGGMIPASHAKALDRVRWDA